MSCDLHVAFSKNGWSWVKAPANRTQERATRPNHLALTLRASATCWAGGHRSRRSHSFLIWSVNRFSWLLRVSSMPGNETTTKNRSR